MAVETADVALVGDDLRRLLDLRELGGATLRVVRQNYGMSIAVNGVGLLVSAGGALSPVLAAVLHNASSVQQGARDGDPLPSPPEKPAPPSPTRVAQPSGRRSTISRTRAARAASSTPDGRSRDCVVLARLTPAGSAAS